MYGGFSVCYCIQTYGNLPPCSTVPVNMYDNVKCMHVPLLQQWMLLKLFSDVL
jgi:hypothetical protein